MRSAFWRSCRLSLARSSPTGVPLLAAWALAIGAAEAAPTLEPIEIRRTSAEIKIDGDLSEEEWKGAVEVTTWFETRPGDNIKPSLENIAYLAYDEKFLYAAFEFEDDEPQRIRAPLGNRDNVPEYTDYGGVIVDASNDGQTAQMFLANPRGIQYDAINSDAAGEDSAPDFYWDSAARVTATGWVLEIRIPFSSLRYSDSNPSQWGILLYRNHPREFRYQMFTSPLPRDSNCFICNVRPLTGLANLPKGSHWVVAPYANASRSARPVAGLGSALDEADSQEDLGVDAKWLPNPSTVVDVTVKPDFSQIESDVAQISANERFALFFPEQRPFFLEGVDLFTTPFRAIFTRSFSQPRWGVRATGELKGNTYTVLVGEDEGGGSVILPRSNSSSLATQDFESKVALARWRRDFGSSFVSTIYSGREIDGGAYNRVFGPDFRIKTDKDTFTGQLLYSTSRTPDRPDLAEEWDGRSLEGHALQLWWNRRTTTWDYFTLYSDVDDEFRADNGFIPQVGLRSTHLEVGRSFYPEDKPVTRLRLFTFGGYTEDRDGRLLVKGITPGFGFDAFWDSFVRFEFAFEEMRGIQKTFARQQIRPVIQVKPSRVLSLLSLQATVGDEVDFANDRLGDGLTLNLGIEIRPTNRLQLSLNGSRRWLDVENEEGLAGRLFTADVGRLRATYTFNAKSWLRLIGEWVATERDPRLYTFDVNDGDKGFGGSAVFAYKLNWQTVLFVGWGDSRAADDLDRLQKAEQQAFLKISYAFRG